MTKLTDILREVLNESEECVYASDRIREMIIDDFFEKYSKDKTYNEEPPKLRKLLDTWDGYDDLTYIQNKMQDGEIVYWEGWVKSCWDGISVKPEYNDMSKVDIIEKVINDRMSKLGKKHRLKMVGYDYKKKMGGYIMSIRYKKI